MNRVSRRIGALLSKACVRLNNDVRSTQIEKVIRTVDSGLHTGMRDLELCHRQNKGDTVFEDNHSAKVDVFVVQAEGPGGFVIPLARGENHMFACQRKP